MADTRTVTGATAAIQKLHRLRDEVLELAVDQDVRQLLLLRVRGRFEMGVDPQGNPWASLLEKTIEKKRRKGYPYPEKPLQASLRLKNAIAIISGSNQGLFAGATGAGFRIGIEDPIAAQYGRIQNYGTSVLPARKFIGLGPLDTRAVQALLNRRLKSISKV